MSLQFIENKQINGHLNQKLYPLIFLNKKHESTEEIYGKDKNNSEKYPEELKFLNEHPEEEESIKEEIYGPFKKENLHFDAIYTGYLGSQEEISITKRIFEEFGGDDTLIFQTVADIVRLNETHKFIPIFIQTCHILIQFFIIFQQNMIWGFYFYGTSVK